MGNGEGFTLEAVVGTLDGEPARGSKLTVAMLELAFSFSRLHRPHSIPLSHEGAEGETH